MDPVHRRPLLAVLTALKLSGSDAKHPNDWFRGLQWLEYFY